MGFSLRAAGGRDSHFRPNSAPGSTEPSGPFVARIPQGRPMNARHALAFAALAVVPTAIGCGPEEEPYKPKPAVSGKKANLPAVPTLPQKVKKTGDAYTVWGVTHDLRSRVHNEDVNN